MGIRGSSTAELAFENCIVTDGNLLGQEGRGVKIAMHILDGGRIGIAARRLGIAEGGLNGAAAHVKPCEQLASRYPRFRTPGLSLRLLTDQCIRFYNFGRIRIKSEAAPLKC